MWFGSTEGRERLRYCVNLQEPLNAKAGESRSPTLCMRRDFAVVRNVTTSPSCFAICLRPVPTGSANKLGSCARQRLVNGLSICTPDSMTASVGCCHVFGFEGNERTLNSSRFRPPCHHNFARLTSSVTSFIVPADAITPLTHSLAPGNCSNSSLET